VPPPSLGKPRLRGWIHAVTAPVALAAGVVLTVRAPTAQATATAGIFSAAGVLLFTLSAVYHRGTWSPRTQAILWRVAWFLTN
jgi:hemolysin III